jgi:glycerol-3-phosphate acyltransferase PlsX
VRAGVAEPTIGLLSNGEEPSKGDQLHKQAFELLQAIPGFCGNVEGRDLMRPGVDVIVSDGFTGNVALKALEGAIRAMAKLVLDALGSTPETRAVHDTVVPVLLGAAEQVDPDHVGGSLLLGVQGVCVIAHGSSRALAIRSAVARALEAVESDVVRRVREAVGGAG